ncbi:DUF4097 family beta strand repeat-containing protein [Dictyobacter kobayashii]|uniref:DUF4097 domain-containing protein n=1 Tax=Dictyobacter kobayashii TaxID=2014872 RepID=A0A402AQ05_9CHLR|nr:DUF4097 family beta strand repeat-containing protein [Dictyobacter kobayashii]GCE21243.1 hypothetical protein KDK_50430 [Dictyobacter kobayashii]
MSQQQSQFEEKWPQESPHVSQYSEAGFQRELNRDPREQQGYAYAPEQTYEYNDPYGQGEKLRPRPPLQSPQRRRRHPLRNLIIALVVLVALVMGAGTISYSMMAVPHYMGKMDGRPQPMMNSTYAGTQLVFHGVNGNLHIHTGNTTDVQMVTNGNVNVKSSIDNGVITLQQVGPDQPGFGDGNIDLTVPQNMPLTIDMARGPVDIEGLTSKMNISAADGEISIENSTLQDGSSLKTANGPINFSGSLESKGSYDFETLNGNIVARLPKDEAVNVSTNTLHGEITNHLNTSTDPNAASVTIKTINGSINVDNQ